MLVLVHSSIVVSQFLAQKYVTLLEHTPFSPDLTPADFVQFFKLIMILKAWNISGTYNNLEVITQNMTVILRSIPLEDFQKAFEKLFNRSK